MTHGRPEISGKQSGPSILDVTSMGMGMGMGSAVGAMSPGEKAPTLES